MYMILWWMKDDYVRAIDNKNGSVKLFNTVKEADAFANKHAFASDLRVISIEGVQDPTDC